MIKKISAKIFILLASILLVAHAVIPHLHYKNEVFIITHACSLDENHKHHAPEHNDKSEQNQHYCLLKQVVFIRLNPAKTEISEPNTDTKSNFNDSPNFVVYSAHEISFKPGLAISPPAVFPSQLYSWVGDSAVSPRGSPSV